MIRILFPPFPDDNSALFPCRYRGRVVDVRPCEVCGGKGPFATIRTCSFQDPGGEEPHPLCAASHFEAIRRVAICSSCPDRKP
jgi:hypothetical protein